MAEYRTTDYSASLLDVSTRPWHASVQAYTRPRGLLGQGDALYAPCVPPPFHYPTLNLLAEPVPYHTCIGVNAIRGEALIFCAELISKMAEFLTIATGAAALACGCAKTATWLRDISRRYQQTSPMIASMAQELATIRCAWDLLQNMLDGWKCQGQVDHELLSRLNDSLESGNLLLSSLNYELSSCTRTPIVPGRCSFRQRTRILWNEKALKNYQERIRGQVMSLSLLILVLKAPGPSHRVEITPGKVSAIRNSLRSAQSMIPSQSSITYGELASQSSPFELPNQSVPSELASQSISSETRDHESLIDEGLFADAVYKRSKSKHALGEVSVCDHAPSGIPAPASSSGTNRESHLQPTIKETALASAAQKSLESCPIQHQPARSAESRVVVDAPAPDRQQKGTEDEKSRPLPRSGLDSNCILPTPSIQENTVGCDEPSIETDTSAIEAEISNEGMELTLLNSCRHGRNDVAEELLQKGVNVHSRVKWHNSRTKGPAAIHVAAMHGQSEVALTLLRCGALVNDSRRGDRRPLHEAADVGDSTMTALLLEHGARPYLRDDQGMEPLHMACRIGSFKAARLLLDAGASLDAADYNGYRPLHYLAQDSGDPYLAAFFIDLGCDVEARTDRGYTALQLACMCGNSRLLEVLLYHGASLEAKEWQAMPLALAVQRGHIEIARLVLEHDSQVDRSCPTTQKTVLHVATEGCARTADDGQVVGSTLTALLCEHGAKINAQDFNGNTALHIALSEGYDDTRSSRRRSMVKTLLANGARVDIANHEGHYPLALASQNPDIQTFRLMLAASLPKLTDKHLARVDQYLRRKRSTASHCKSREMSALLAAALIARAFDV
ncbi:MAG: hypothetical protein Q9181_002607 [Wetmoreana brouardii]